MQIFSISKRMSVLIMVDLLLEHRRTKHKELQSTLHNNYFI